MTIPAELMPVVQITLPLIAAIAIAGWLQNRRVDEISKRIDDIGARINDVGGRIDRVDARLDRGPVRIDQP
jgi:hypothetical protein